MSSHKDLRCCLSVECLRIVRQVSVRDKFHTNANNYLEGTCSPMTLPAFFLSPQSPQFILSLLDSNLSDSCRMAGLASIPERARTTQSLSLLSAQRTDLCAKERKHVQALPMMVDLPSWVKFFTAVLWAELSLLGRGRVVSSWTDTALYLSRYAGIHVPVPYLF